MEKKGLENDANVTLPTFSVIEVGRPEEIGADPVLTESRQSALGKHCLHPDIPTAMADIGWGRNNDARL